MSTLPPPEPEFGASLPIGPARPSVLDFLAARRSASAGVLAEPAPSPAQLDGLLRLAARAPDHGKLAPWRFIVLDGVDKAAFVAGLEAIASAGAEAERPHAALLKIRNPPLSVVVVSHPVEGKIPRWEQELSAGAVCMALVTAAQAMGFGANWITDWYAYDAKAVGLLGLAEGERVAGYIHLGTPSEAPRERARPDVAALTTRWIPR